MVQHMALVHQPTQGWQLGIALVCTHLDISPAGLEFVAYYPGQLLALPGLQAAINNRQCGVATRCTEEPEQYQDCG